MIVTRSRLVLVALVFILSTIVNGVLFYYFEAVKGPRRDLGFFDAVYWAVITTATVGYGDVVPETVAGRIVALEAAVIGIAVFTLLVSMIAEAFLEQGLRRTMGLARLKNVDVVVIGSSEVCREAVDELRASMPDYHIAWVLEEQPRTLPEDVDFVVGDPTDEEVLARAGAEKAKHAIICILDDAASLHTALVLRKLNKAISISAVAKSKKTVELLREAGASMVVPLRIIGRQLASTVFEPSVALFLEEVTTSRSSADLVEAIVGREFDGRTVEVFVGYLEDRDKENTYIPLMVMRTTANGTEKIPIHNRSIRLKAGDRLVALKVRRVLK